MNVLEQFGVGVEDLDTQDPEFDMAPVVPGSTLQIDADFTCYEVSAVTKAYQEEIDAGTKEPRTLDELANGIQMVFRKMTRMAGCEFYKAHVTPGGTTKGNRAAAALTKPYQGNRVDKEKPPLLDALRGRVGEHEHGVVWLDQEADDGLTQANYTAVMAGEARSSVIWSRDKDLLMAPGWHWNHKRKELAFVDIKEFGTLELEQHELPSGKMSSKKCQGYGVAFFWAQCLMGDTADNIAGLPMIDGEFLFNHGIGKAGQKARKCGGVMAHTLISKCKDHGEAFTLVSEAFKTSPHDFVNWRDQQPITPMQALGGDMFCLWMRRSKGDKDFAKFFTQEVAELL